MDRIGVVDVGVEGAALPRQAGRPDEARDPVQGDAADPAVEGEQQGIVQRGHRAVQGELHFVQPSLQREGRWRLGSPGQQLVQRQLRVA